MFEISLKSWAHDQHILPMGTAPRVRIQAHVLAWLRMGDHTSRQLPRLRWAVDFAGAYPRINRLADTLAEEAWRAKETKARKARKAERRAKKAAAAAAVGTIQELPADKPAAPVASPKPAPQTPIAFLFPGQGSQAVGMLKV